jgi:DNA-binding LacI/PurR family transcriptional regulator
MAKSTPKYKNLKSLSPSKIFKGYAKSSDRFDQPDINIKLSFSLWGDLQFTSFASQQLYAAITSYINELGHDVKINSIFRNYRDPLPIEQVTEKLRSSVDVCDGYIVIANVANIFDRAKKGLDISTVYFAAGNLPVYEPMVMFDTGEAVERAFRIFARQGYKKIALLALASSELYTKPEKSIYLKEIEQHDFSYSNIIQIPQPPTIGATMNAVREAFDSKEPPEAIYIADDNFMPAVIEVLNSRGIKPGRDIAIITLSNKGIALPESHNWSRLEFHPDELAKEVMNKLLARVLRGERTPPSTTILARFVNGDTHIIK